MEKGWRRYTPAVRPAVLILASACLWSAIGAALFIKGCYRCRLYPDQALFLLPLGVATGTLKSHMLLDSSARSGLERLRRLSGLTCLGAVYSWKTWIMVLCMMALGGILQNSAIPPQFLTLFTLAVGWALLYSSRLAWGAWREG